jgi:hypothetical protein
MELETQKISQIGANLKFIFPASFPSQGVLSKDPTVWLDGTRPHLPTSKYVCKYIKFVKLSGIQHIDMANSMTIKYFQII